VHSNISDQTKSKHYWLALKLIARLAIHKKLALVKSYGLSALFSTEEHQSKLTSAHGLTAKQLNGFHHPDWDKINSILQASHFCQSEIIVFDDPLYPDLLKQIYDPPLLLFVQGNVQLLNTKQLAIVGSRSASPKGREIAFDLAKKLAEQQFIVTSGLALGVDAAAHRGALKTQGSTIAVVATGLDKVYPARHRDLATEIISNKGAIVSEFLPGTAPKAGHFPKRNRLISGLSCGVLVVEAALKSGSLITARCALEQNREVFAVPSSIENPQAKGCHWLMNQGAKLVEQVADIVDELALVAEPSLHLKDEGEDIQLTNQYLLEETETKSQLKDLYKDGLLASVGFEITPIDKVVSRSKLPIEEVLIRLTMLELSGLVSAVPGGYIRV
jgi:DNA processing protein